MDDLIHLAKARDVLPSNSSSLEQQPLSKKQRRNKGKSEKKKAKAATLKTTSKLMNTHTLITSDNDNDGDDDDDDENDDTNIQEEYPYTVEKDDHCESPFEAYEHIATSLTKIAKALNKDIGSLAIYDPYFCEGSMVEHLRKLGFTNVYNKKEDFYAVQASGQGPTYDVLVTNPPYSADHVEKLLQFSGGSKKPFFLLMPNFVYAKDYYCSALSKSVVPFYLSPIKRYSYTTPKGRRQAKSAKYTSPFPSFWYCHLGDHLKSLIHLSSLLDMMDKTKVFLSTDFSKLPIAVLHDSDPRKKKEKNAKKRDKHKARKNLKVVP